MHIFKICWNTVIKTVFFLAEKRHIEVFKHYFNWNRQTLCRKYIIVKEQILAFVWVCVLLINAFSFIQKRKEWYIYFKYGIVISWSSILRLLLLFLCVCSTTQSCLILCNPMDCNLPGPQSGIFQARILEQVAISYSRGSSPPRDWTPVPWASCIDRQT